MFLISREVSSRTSFFRTNSMMSVQWSRVVFGRWWKSVVLILPPGTHHLFGNAFSFGLLLQIRYLPSLFRIIAVTEIWWVFVSWDFRDSLWLADCTDSRRFGNCFISSII